MIDDNKRVYMRDARPLRKVNACASSCHLSSFIVNPLALSLYARDPQRFALETGSWRGEADARDQLNGLDVVTVTLNLAPFRLPSTQHSSAKG